VAAPAIVYRGDILVCGHSLEVNAVTDIEVRFTNVLVFNGTMFKKSPTFLSLREEHKLKVSEKKGLSKIF
jgi:hypothetical protein